VVREPVDLSALARDAAERLAVSLPEGVGLCLELADDLSAVPGDPDQLRQVLVNLLLNAIEACREVSGEITLRTRQGRIDRAALLHDYLGRSGRDAGAVRGVLCEVSDSGSGIAPETVERIFDPFYTTRFMGRGLGLAAVLGIVRSHHGGIGVQSGPGAGTTIRVVLPAAEDRPHEAGARA
jgi:signal transduction histidine kinase